MEDAEPSRRYRRRRLGRVDAAPRRLAADELHGRVADEVVEGADGVRAAADAGEHGVGQPPFDFGELLLYLLRYDRLEVAHYRREGVRPHARAEDVMRVGDAARPLAHRLADGVLQSSRAALDGVDFRAEQPHAVDVERLTLDVLAPHEDLALHAEERRRRRRSDAVLPRAGLGDEARLAHALREERLSENVVYLVRAGVVQILALEVYLRAAQVLRHALREVEPRRPARVVVKQRGELAPEIRVVLVPVVSLFKLDDGVHQRLGNVLPAVFAEPSSAHL